jgi:hypothetical protein
MKKIYFVLVMICISLILVGCANQQKNILSEQAVNTTEIDIKTNIINTSSTDSSDLHAENKTQSNQTSLPLSVVSPTTNIKFEGKYVDVHTHIIPAGMSLEEIIKNMDIEGIDTMIIMETPTAIYRETSQADYGIPSAAEKYPERFVALYGGEAITLLDSVVKKGSYTKSEEERYTTLLEDAMKSGKYNGFGEVALRHVSLGGEGADVTIPGDHPWMFIMSDIAAKYDVPIDVHMDVETGDEGIAGLENLLDYNKNTKIVWSHTAWSRNNYKSGSVESMRQLLERHPNLYSSIKIQTETEFMDGSLGMTQPSSGSGTKQQSQKGTGSGTKQQPSAGTGSDTTQQPSQGTSMTINSEWLALFKDYPNRFMIGSDIKPGERDDEFKYVKAHRKFLEQLPSEILKAFERDNAKEIFKIN